MTNTALREIDFLNKIDLRQLIYLMEDRSVEEIMGKIEDIYHEQYYALYKSYLFIALDEEGFIDYINERYGIKYTEQVVRFFSI